MANSNIYIKLSQARVSLQEKKLKKSGKNTYSNFEYFELKDFLPSVNELCKDLGILTVFFMEHTAGVEMAYLDVFNTEEPNDFIRFCIPTADVEIGIKKDGSGGAQPIQNQGGKVTYMRRYLFLAAFEITEDDAVDAQPQAKNSGLKIPASTLKQIQEAKNLQELASITQTAKSTLGEKYNGVLVKAYLSRKEELSGDN